MHGNREVCSYQHFELNASLGEQICKAYKTSLTQYSRESWVVVIFEKFNLDRTESWFKLNSAWFSSVFFALKTGKPDKSFKMTCFSFWPAPLGLPVIFSSLGCRAFRLCLFSGIHFPGNHFPNFPAFVCLSESWSTKNTFQSKENLAWFSGKCFPGKFGRKTPSGSCEKFRNVILFANYIKFGPQTFDCYIYFVLNIYFQFHLLKFNFYINFGPHFYNCYLLFSYYFFIEIFFVSNLFIILLIVTYFIWNNLWNVNYYYFNFFIFHFFFIF